MVFESIANGMHNVIHDAFWYWRLTETSPVFRLGSYGSIPKAIVAKLREYQEMTEARPDQFIRYDLPKLLDESRAAVAQVVNAPAETVVFVGNATEGVNTVFRNLVWNEDGKDVIMTFSTVYDACGKVVDYLVDYFGSDRLSSREIQIEYPIEDDEILRRFRDTVKEIEAEGKRARVCMFDVVSSHPGVCFPWVEMAKACKELGVLSVVDGAQGIGMVKLDLTAADPDFFVTNCHKWLPVPRGCALFYVPLRNHHLVPTTLATSHGYISKSTKRPCPLVHDDTKSNFVSNFDFSGTRDFGPYLCVKDAIAYRRDVQGGEERILEYLWRLNKQGAQYVAEQLDSFVLNNSKGTMTNCAMANIALPIWVEKKGEGAKEGDVVVSAEGAERTRQWIMKTMSDEYKTLMPLGIYSGRLWVRTSAQVYLEMKDYEYAAKVLKELLERVVKGEVPGEK